ncbi:hypothetical protein GJ496_008745 [Pomphorhynchus laevis]|nr:hypothetical protein GJ496_008745 [Pomphorhynchus laevis]
MSEVIIDALPYYDTDYEEKGATDASLALIEEETKRYRPTKNYLEYLGQANYHAFETEISKNEFERLSNRLPMETLDMIRCELPGPLPGKSTDIASWIDCVNNSYAQLEHQQMRLINLENMMKYGAEAWKQHNTSLQALFDQAQRYLFTLRKEIQKINMQRQSEQIEAGKQLSHLENIWVGLVSKNYEIECAISDLVKQTSI